MLVHCPLNSSHCVHARLNVIDAFNITSRYLYDIFNSNNVYLDNMVSQIYPSELQLNKANTSDTEAAFLDLHCLFLMI